MLVHRRAPGRSPAGAAGLLAGAGLLACLALACSRDQRPLRLRDLGPAERLYVERFISLERARAVAMADSAGGEALLDSLAAAWGDSALERSLAGLPRHPARAAALHDLVARLLEAEADSLLLAPLPRRLRAPLPTPTPAPRR